VVFAVWCGVVDGRWMVRKEEIIIRTCFFFFSSFFQCQSVSIDEGGLK